MSTKRATKSGFALEAQTKIFGKYDENLAQKTLQWVADVTGESFPTDGGHENFIDVLRDGLVLCKLANKLCSGAISERKMHTGNIKFKQLENIAFFLIFLENKAGVNKAELFQTVDLCEGQDPNSVLTAITALARKSQQTFGVKGFGPKESEKIQRQWTEEQLREGQGIIGLQMGSNQGASQAGMNMGNSRHM
jgi:hypothetical protein